MTLVLELPPIVETQLRADAKARGVDMETLALETLAFTPFRGDATAREAARLWARLVDPNWLTPKRTMRPFTKLRRLRRRCAR